MKRSIILGSAAAAIVAVAYLWPGLGASLGNGGGAVTANAGHERVTLDPNQFTGPAKQAYEVAEKNPALLAQLHCYCGCDKIYGHQSLLDCYRGIHGSKCEICIGEALMAEQLSEQGSPVEQIRDALRRNYAGEN